MELFFKGLLIRPQTLVTPCRGFNITHVGFLEGVVSHFLVTSTNYIRRIPTHHLS